MPAFQAATRINVLAGRIVLCGRQEVETGTVFEQPRGVLLCCAGKNTRSYDYDEKSANWTKMTVGRTTRL